MLVGHLPLGPSFAAMTHILSMSPLEGITFFFGCCTPKSNDLQSVMGAWCLGKATSLGKRAHLVRSWKLSRVGGEQAGE